MSPLAIAGALVVCASGCAAGLAEEPPPAVGAMIGESHEAEPAPLDDTIDPPTLPELAARWDRDGDGVLGEDELAAGLLTEWDGDGDGVVDPAELAAAREAWIPPHAVTRQVNVDLDGDAETVVTELEGAEERDAFAFFDDDGDGVITAEELTDSMVARWDEDGDGVLSREEWPA